MTEANLKPCPFCGLENPPLSGWPEMGLCGYRICCTDIDCLAIGPACKTAEDAVEKWNRRAGNSEPTDGGVK